MIFSRSDIEAAELVLPFCKTKTMSLHLAEISLMVAPGNISIIALPVKYPEVNSVETIWQFMRDDWLSNRIF